MSIQQMLIVLVVLGVAYASYNAWRAKTRIYCTFTRRDNTESHKWAKAVNGERIEFANGWYYVMGRYITTESLDTGFNWIFPTMVRKLRFSWKSEFPLDPATGEPANVTPEMRKALDKREDIEAYSVGTHRAISKQKTGLMGGGWMPIILIGGLLIVGYFVYQMRGDINRLGMAINVLQELSLKALNK